MSNNNCMFCTSLRKRKEWTAIPPFLLKAVAPWQEKSLETHDLAIPISRVENRLLTWFHFRILLLSPSDMVPSANVMARVERLYHQTGGRNVAIFFLLNEIRNNDNGTIAYMNLQASLLGTFQIPLLPLSSTEQLLPTIQAFQNQRFGSKLYSIANAQYELLPACTVSPRSMLEHTRNVLSDACVSIRQLAEAATDPTGQSQAQLRKWLSLSEPQRTGMSEEDILDFWKQEYVIE